MYSSAENFVGGERIEEEGACPRVARGGNAA
jgi:hypothetical protein